MTKLPAWVDEIKNQNRGYLDAYEGKLLKALSIAWEALSILNNSVTGVYYLGEEKEIKTIQEAMRRIEELSK